MERYPLVWEGRPSGALLAEREGLYTVLTARTSFCREGLWYAWAIGAEGELRLGVLEPAGEEAVIRRRISQRSMAPLGKLVRGEVRPAGAVREDWKPAPEPDRLFHTPWLRQQLRGVEGALTERRGTLRYLALPFDQRRPFPLAPLFCLARLRELNGRRYVVYTFNDQDWPVFGDEERP